MQNDSGEFSNRYYGVPRHKMIPIGRILRQIDLSYSGS